MQPCQPNRGLAYGLCTAGWHQPFYSGLSPAVSKSGLPSSTSKSFAFRARLNAQPCVTVQLLHWVADRARFQSPRDMLSCTKRERWEKQAKQVAHQGTMPSNWVCCMSRGIITSISFLTEQLFGENAHQTAVLHSPPPPHKSDRIRPDCPLSKLLWRVNPAHAAVQSVRYWPSHAHRTGMSGSGLNSRLALFPRLLNAYFTRSASAVPAPPATALLRARSGRAAGAAHRSWLLWERSRRGPAGVAVGAPAGPTGGAAACARAEPASVRGSCGETLQGAKGMVYLGRVGLLGRRHSAGGSGVAHWCNPPRGCCQGWAEQGAASPSHNRTWG